MDISMLELSAVAIASAVSGSGITVSGYLAYIHTGRPRHAAGPAGKHRAEFGADEQYAEALAAIRTGDIIPLDPHGQGDVEVEGSDQPAVAGDITAVMEDLADDIRAAAERVAGRPVPPPVTPPAYARPYVLAVTGGGR